MLLIRTLPAMMRGQLCDEVREKWGEFFKDFRAKRESKQMKNLQLPEPLTAAHFGKNKQL